MSSQHTTDAGFDSCLQREGFIALELRVSPRVLARDANQPAGGETKINK